MEEVTYLPSTLIHIRQAKTNPYSIENVSRVGWRREEKGNIQWNFLQIVVMSGCKFGVRKSRKVELLNARNWKLHSLLCLSIFMACSPLLHDLLLPAQDLLWPPTGLKVEADTLGPDEKKKSKLDHWSSSSKSTVCQFIFYYQFMYISIITSDLEEPTTQPPLSLSLPPTIEARALDNGRGRLAIGVQAVAPGRRVSTEERMLVPSYPPATTKACK